MYHSRWSLLSRSLVPSFPCSLLYLRCYHKTVQTIRVDTPSARYDVFAGTGLLESLAPRIERAIGPLPRRVFVLTSPEIWSLWSATFLRSFAEPPITLFLPPGERHKTMANVDRFT